MQDDETGTEPSGGTGWPATGYGTAGKGEAARPGEATRADQAARTDEVASPDETAGPGTTTGAADVLSAGQMGGWGSPPEPGVLDGSSAEPPRRRRRGRRVALYAIVAILAAGLGAAATVGLNGSQATPVTGVSSHQVPGPQDDAGNSRGGSLNKSYVAARVEPGVVDIDAAIQYSGGTSSEGTGMVISTDGLVLTNNHVINGAKTIRVTLVTTGRVFQSTVVGYDATHDVALLKLDGAARLKAVTVGNSAQVTLGTPVLAVGNAEGQGGLPALAVGIINSLGKTISPTDESTGSTETLHGMLQTNADIVSGDSGGPLANSAGQVIGMDTANASSSQGSSAVLGYAIPINTALAVAHQIAAGQASATVQIGLPGFLGVLVPQSNSASPAQQARQQRQQIQQQQQPGTGLPGNGNGNGSSQPPQGTSCADNDADTSVPSPIAPAGSGALVDGVLCGTAAATLGLASGDVITSVNGQAVTTPGSLTAMMSGFRPGTKVTLSWETVSGNHKRGTLTLGAAPAR
jgi:S1-C subfamily serine protease